MTICELFAWIASARSLSLFRAVELPSCHVGLLALDRERLRLPLQLHALVVTDLFEQRSDALRVGSVHRGSPLAGLRCSLGSLTGAGDAAGSGRYSA